MSTLIHRENYFTIQYYDILDKDKYINYVNKHPKLFSGQNAKFKTYPQRSLPLILLKNVSSVPLHHWLVIEAVSQYGVVLENTWTSPEGQKIEKMPELIVIPTPELERYCEY